jgi:hypothetical protein
MDPVTRPALFVLLVMLVPAALAGVGLLVGALIRAGKPLAGGGAFVLGVAYLVGHFFALPAPPKFPPAASNDALFWAGAFATMAGVLIGGRERFKRFNALIVAGAACLATAYVLRRIVGRMSGSEQVELFGAVALLSALSFLGAERTAEKNSGTTSPFMLWIVATALALAHAFSAAANYASYAAVLAALLGAGIVVAFIRRNVNYSRGVSAVVVVHVAVLCAAGVHLAELPKAAAVLLMVAPAASALIGEGRTQAWGSKKALVVRAALVALPAVAAVALCAYEQAQRTSSPYGY